MNDPTPGSVDLPVPHGKVFARNLTARADHVVRGNPAGSRPESGVDNCFPGLEFDQRNLDKCFFPGLTVDFHHGSGSRVIAVAEGAATVSDLTSEDLQVTEQSPWRLHLWAVCGRTAVDQSEAQAPVLSARRLDGMSMWRFVHDLLPGRIAIRLGPRPGRISPGESGVPGGSLNALRMANESRVVRDAAGRVTSAVLVADRADYLTEDGVIDPAVYLPGDLTRSLCAPWQYDFRECGCFYWAASKPDISASHDGKFHPLNFQRSNRTAVPPELDGPSYFPRNAQELDHPALITNWNVLPVVLNGREDDSLGLPAPLVLDPKTRPEVEQRLEHLARVEHALCVEYLYAHYSLNAPREIDPATEADAPERKFFAAAQEVFAVAQDEMRHLRWVNEILGVLGRPIVLDPPTEELVIQEETRTTFRLEPLNQAQLDWFIKVEETSADLNPQGIDGMYVRLHQTILDEKEDPYPQADRLSHLIKLIIDEGVDHFERFKKVKAHLAGFSETEYLRTLTQDPTDPLDQRLLELGDLNYAVLLGTLKDSLGGGDTSGGIEIEHSRQAMANFHEVNHLLAARGVAPRFNGPGPLGNGQATLAAARSAMTLQQTISSLDGPALGAMMTRHRADMQALIDALTP
ncbi:MULTISPECIES: ferritin-like domain-containing protein [unclassified Streptomyces]|uniref:ferritin-like domain-containing protein n=1 Tax=unclassified Streptomyces TaxID=2593676 RepID=UPI002E29BD76|nr:ferritin-like domain-containing protein [Streptomyces sp. NBC_00273]